MSLQTKIWQGQTLASTQGGTFIKVVSFNLGEYATTEKLSKQIGAMLQNHNVVVLTDIAHSWTNWLMSRPGDDSCPSFDAGLYEVTVLSEVFVFFSLYFAYVEVPCSG